MLTGLSSSLRSKCSRCGCASVNGTDILSVGMMLCNIMPTDKMSVRCPSSRPYFVSHSRVYTSTRLHAVYRSARSVRWRQHLSATALTRASRPHHGPLSTRTLVYHEADESCAEFAFAGPLAFPPPNARRIPATPSCPLCQRSGRVPWLVPVRTQTLHSRARPCLRVYCERQNPHALRRSPCRFNPRQPVSLALPWVGSRSPDGWDQIPRWAGGWGLHQPPWSFGFDSQTRGTRENRAPPCVKVPGSSRVPSTCPPLSPSVV